MCSKWYLINNLKKTIHFLKNKRQFENNSKYDISPKNFFNPKVKSYQISEIDLYINTNQKFYERFNNLMKLIMKLEMEIEKEKINFVKNSEITFKEIYLIFDKDRKGYITEEELRKKFDKLKIIEEESFDIFMNRYDLLKRQKIEESEFFDIIVPFNKTYRKYFENKIIRNRNEDSDLLEDINIFLSLKNLFSFLINKEKEINNYKINFIKNKNNSNKIYQIFNIIDKDEKGFFSYEDLNCYLKNNNINIDDYSSALLFIRLDKKRQGKIDMEDLIEEL